jgi:hypothetical protein
MLEELATQAFWFGLAKIIGVNVILSGDNAVVIALAARSLPPQQQKKAVLWGAGAAVFCASCSPSSPRRSSRCRGSRSWARCSFSGSA